MPAETYRIVTETSDLAPAGFVGNTSLLAGQRTKPARGTVHKVRHYPQLAETLYGENVKTADSFKLPSIKSFSDVRAHNKLYGFRVDLSNLRADAKRAEERMSTKPETKPYQARDFSEGSQPRAAAAEADRAAQVEAILAELDSMIGLDSVKRHIRQLVNFQRVMHRRDAASMPTPVVSHHLAFEGPPGTGKTTVARIVARLYHALGVTSSDRVVETDRGGLVGAYVGHTARQTAKQISRARGGVLFIDEAYALASKSRDDFGKEAIATLLKAMEDHRDDLVIIFAGYSKEMEALWNSNSGLASRVPDRNKIVFPSYTTGELVDITVSHATEAGYSLSSEAKETVRGLADRVVRDSRFGNGRWSRDLVETAVMEQASRIVIDDGALDELHASDFVPGDDPIELAPVNPGTESGGSDGDPAATALTTAKDEEVSGTDPTH